MAGVEHVVVVGASLGGFRTAYELRRGGFAGRITVVGEERHQPYDRPPLSKAHLLDAEPAAEPLAPGDMLAALDLDLRLGVGATALDVSGRTVSLDDGTTVGWDQLVVATGSVARRLPGTEGVAGVHVLRTLDDAVALRADLDAAERVVVVGAGFIGAEVASAARARGLAVTVLEALPVPLARGLGPVLGPAVAALQTHNGVELRCGASVAAVEGGTEPGGRGVERVVLADGEVVEADVVVVGIGAAPATGWLAGSGLEVRDGVVCDESCRAVGAPGVWAVGDVARWRHPRLGELRLEHWDNATRQASAVAANIVATAGGGEPTPFGPVPYVWSDQHGLTIQVLGVVGAGDEVHVPIGSLDERRFVALVTRDGVLTAAVGMGDSRAMRFRRLLGASATTREALDLARSL